MRKQISAVLLAAFMFANISAFAADDSAMKTEHLLLPEKVFKNAPTNVVVKTPTLDTIIEYNIIELTFAKNIKSKDLREGDHIPFVIKNGLKTLEGSEIVPEGTIVDSVVTKLEPPKSFNRSGKVHLAFTEMRLPDGKVIPIQAKLASKKDFLSRGKLNAMGKGMASTLGGAAVGTGAGCGIGVAAGAVIVGGFAIGLPVGLTVGALAGLVTPGLQYKANAGDTILIQLTDNVTIHKDIFKHF